MCPSINMSKSYGTDDLFPFPHVLSDSSHLSKSTLLHELFETDIYSKGEIILKSPRDFVILVDRFGLYLFKNGYLVKKKYQSTLKTCKGNFKIFLVPKNENYSTSFFVRGLNSYVFLDGNLTLWKISSVDCSMTKIYKNFYQYFLIKPEVGRRPNLIGFNSQNGTIDLINLRTKQVKVLFEEFDDIMNFFPMKRNRLLVVSNIRGKMVLSLLKYPNSKGKMIMKGPKRVDFVAPTKKGESVDLVRGVDFDERYGLLCFSTQINARNTSRLSRMVLVQVRYDKIRIWADFHMQSNGFSYEGFLKLFDIGNGLLQILMMSTVQMDDLGSLASSTGVRTKENTFFESVMTKEISFNPSLAALAYGKSFGIFSEIVSVKRRKMLKKNFKFEHEIHENGSIPLGLQCGHKLGNMLVGVDASMDIFKLSV